MQIVSHSSGISIGVPSTFHSSATDRSEPVWFLHFLSTVKGIEGPLSISLCTLKAVNVSDRHSINIVAPESLEHMRIMDRVFDPDNVAWTNLRVSVTTCKTNEIPSPEYCSEQCR